MFYKTVAVFGLMILALNSGTYAAQKTTGTPLGGFGASYITYNAVNGKFAKGYRLTNQHWYQEALISASFNLYTNVGGSVKTVAAMKSSNEDALIPIYKVGFGSATNNIDVNLLAFGPFVSGDEKSSVMPLAFFEFSVENKNATAAEAAIAFQISDLAGTAPTRLTAGNGVAWAGTDNSALGAASDLETAVITTGNALAPFNTSGALPNADGGIVAVKLNLEPSQVGKIRFVVGWYQEFSDKDCNDQLLNEGFYYQNFVTNATEAITYGLSEFTRIRDGASSFVNRLRAVNLPDWYTDRLCNNLYPFVHNGQFAKDGRVAWREGKYFIIGTIDQQGHAQIASSYNWPQGQWRQFEYWLRTQWQGEYLGQIHHDFNGPKSGTDKINAMCTWDDFNHNDYWWSKTKNWSDLNSLTLINIYELFLCTGDTSKVRQFWSKMLLTGQRLLFQATNCIDNQYQAPPAPYDSSNFVLPFNCLGSYDREGATNEYNASLALNAYYGLKEMALALGETAEAAKWEDIFNRGREQFSTIYSSKTTFGSTVEGQLGSYSWSRHLGIPTIMSDQEAEAGFARYWVKSANGTDLLPWHFYTISHFADMGIAIGKVDDGLKVHKQDYEQHCISKPEFYFWQDLDASPGLHSYMTGPVVWRSLMLITGYCLDKFNQRLWLRPMLPTENAGKLTNAPLVSPGNWGTMDYTETENGKTQALSVRFDQPIPIKEIRLKNPDGLDHTIVVKGSSGEDIPVTVTKSGTGLDAVQILTFAEPVQLGYGGIAIGVDADPFISVKHMRVSQQKTNRINVLSAIGKTQTVQFEIDNPGKVAIQMYNLNGTLIRSVNLGSKTAGTYSFTNSNVANGMYFLRLMHNGICRATSTIMVAR